MQQDKIIGVFIINKLYHEFFIKDKFHKDTDYIPYEERKETVLLDDDFIWYIYDSLKWLKNYNPSKREFCDGLCLYGITKISGDSLVKFKNIIGVYRDLFKYAPNKLVLTGLYDKKNNRYEKLEYGKKELLSKLNLLIHICEKALSDNKYLLHYGL